MKEAGGYQYRNRAGTNGQCMPVFEPDGLGKSMKNRFLGPRYLPDATTLAIACLAS